MDEPQEPRYAHTLEGAGTDRWQTMQKHLAGVARLAGDHAGAFGSRAWGELAGLWHDLGKYAEDFQSYLRASSRDPAILDASVLDEPRGPGKKVDHSTAGAAFVYEKCQGKLGGRERNELPPTALTLAMVIAGHHGGLPKRCQFEQERLTAEEKTSRLRAAKSGGAPSDLLAHELPPPPDFLRPEALQGAASSREERLRLFQLRHEFWTRMLFSALVDADSLDTEAFCNPERSRVRDRAKGDETLLTRMKERLDAHLLRVADRGRERADSLPAGARERAEAVLDLRARVLAACRGRAKAPPGRRSLTVPTGGGKTLSALAYALEHAIKNGLRRVIVVIPFTSIIDQTAGVYRDAFGDDLAEFVIEHHSNLDPEREEYHSRLASENWDAPVVVTTSVQFFESLFSHKRSATRKLHNIARSVVVFDEVQTLPHELREPIFDALNELVDHYGVSALFCTATQPALSLKQVGLQDFPHLVDVEEVIDDVGAQFGAVADRVSVEFPEDDGPTTWEALAARVREHDRALAIVHRRDDARLLAEAVGPGTVHLSTRMCPTHRREVIERIRADLAAGRPIRVVSTTLIEAGVDLDFPTVFRALGGADSCAQAAGRCNREGRLTDAEGYPIPGRLILFRAPSDPPPGLRLGLQVADTLRRSGDPLDLFDPTTFDRYFREYFSSINVDRTEVTLSRTERDFPEVDARFRIIEEDGKAGVVVPYGGFEAGVRDYERDPCRRTLRGLQPFLVNAHEHDLAFFRKEGLIQTIHEQVHVLRAPGPQYDPTYGLIVDRVVPADPGALITDP